MGGIRTALELLFCGHHSIQLNTFHYSFQEPQLQGRSWSGWQERYIKVIDFDSPNAHEISQINMPTGFAQQYNASFSFSAECIKHQLCIACTLDAATKDWGRGKWWSDKGCTFTPPAAMQQQLNFPEAAEIQYYFSYRPNILKYILNQPISQQHLEWHGVLSISTARKISTLAL